MADSTPKSYSTDPALYLYTSLTSGSSHIVTATSRLETILKANKIPFKALDIATDEKARMLWGRRAGKDESGRARKLPGLVQMGLVVGDLVEIEDWNEYGELKEHITIVHNAGTPARSAVPTPSEPSKAIELSKPSAGAMPTSFTLAMRKAGQEAAQKAKEAKNKVVEALDGTGEAEPTEKKPGQSAVIPPPIAATDPPSSQRTIDTIVLLQSPTTTTWSYTPGKYSKPTTPRHSVERLESMQSPTSTAWKPTDIDRPIASSVSLASPDKIKEIEQNEAIAEEDEGEDEDKNED